MVKIGRRLEAYQVFFPLGWFYGVGGAGVWVLFWMGVLTYPALLHVHWMVEGFVLSFVMGVLMTAIPRWTDSIPAERWEIVGAFGGGASLLLYPWVESFIHADVLCDLRALILWVGLLVFLLRRRVFRKTAIGMARMRCVGMALFLGIAGVLMLLGIHSERVSPMWSDLGKGCVYLGSLLCFVFGGGPWNLSRKPGIQHRMSWGVFWAAAWAGVAGLWVYFLFPGVGIHGLHGVFMGGFGVLILVSASHVTWGQETRKRRLSALLSVAGICVGVAVLTRMLASGVPHGYVSHLAYAGLAWILGWGIWGALFISRMGGMCIPSVRTS